MADIGGRIRRETVDFDEFKGHRFSKWYKAMVPKSRIGKERRLSRTGASEMSLPAQAMDQADPNVLGSSPPTRGMRKLSVSGPSEGLQNFVKRETGAHYFYLPVVGFLDGQVAAVYEFQLREQGKPPITVHVGSTHKERGDKSPRHRIQQFLENGERKEELIEDALNNGCEIWLRITQDMKKMELTNDIENELLDKYDYAWNARRNRGVRAVEDLE